MHSAKLTTAKIGFIFIVACCLQLTINAQENSPYSRYGMGDLAPNHNIFTRGMGGVSAATIDYQSLNTVNPAALGSITKTIFDVGSEIDFRTLKSLNPVKKSNSVNTLFSYLQMGVPLTTEKMRKKNVGWGLSFGIKPITKINYKIETNSRLSNIDSLSTLYEGNGGINQAFIGTGFKIKNLSIGATLGYMFGSKDYSTKLTFINDSIDYSKTNYENQTSFNGVVATYGLQYQFILNKNKKLEVPKVLRFGAYGNLQQKFKASRNDTKETFSYDGNGGTFRLDSVAITKNVKGTIEYPSSFGVGLAYQDEHWLIGADYEATKWSNYKFYGQSDAVQNNWVVRVGAQYFPAKQNTPVKKYLNFVRYRAGFYYGPDYIKTNTTRPDYAFTVGAGLPLTSLKQINYYGEFVTLNTGLEIGGRGNKNSNIKENVVRFSLGLSMNATWFIKRKYN